MKHFTFLLLLWLLSLSPLLAQSPTFTLSASPGSQTITGSTANFAVNVTPHNGFKASVVLRVYSPTLPAALFAMQRGFLNPPYGMTDTATVTLTGPKTGGTHEIIVEGRNGGLTVRDTVELTIPSREAWQVFNTFNSPLPTNDLWDVVLDTNGHGWIATQNHLIEFDGTDWTIHDTSTGFPFAPNYTLTGIPWVILEIAVDSSNNVWVTDGRALAKYDGTTWTEYSDTAFQAFYYDIAADAQGNIWIANGSRGIMKFDGVNWTTYTPEIRKAALIHIAVDGDGAVWATEGDDGGRGVKKFDGSFWTYILPTDLDYQALKTIVADREGNPWIASERNLFRFDSLSPTPYRSSNSWGSFPGILPQALDFDAEGNIWVGTRYGVGKKSSTDWEFYRINNSGLPHENITAVKVANDMSVWITTAGGGLAILDGTQSGYNSISTSGVVSESLSGGGLTLYPNPVQLGNPIHISGDNIPNSRFILYNVRGEKLAEIVSNNGLQGELLIDSKGLKPGIYYIQAQAENRENIVRPVIVVD